MRDCPAPERLGRFLREEIGDEERGLIEAHVEECGACQEALDDLALNTPGPAPPNLRAALSESIPAEAADDAETFIERLRQQVSDLLICGILTWGQRRDFGSACKRVDEPQIRARIRELGRVKMFQQVDDCFVGTRIRHRMNLHT